MTIQDLLDEEIELYEITVRMHDYIKEISSDVYKGSSYNCPTEYRNIPIRYMYAIESNLILELTTSN